MSPVTRNKRMIHRGRKFSFVEEEYQLDDGRIQTFDKVEHPGAVVILPVSNDGNVVLLRQYRQALRKEILELPAGTLEPGEDPLFCAKRELAEEIGSAARSWLDLGTLYPAPGFCDELQYCYLARDLSPESADKDADEVLEPVFYSVAEVETAIRNNTFCDAKSLALFARADSVR